MRRFALLEHVRGGSIHWDLLVEADPVGSGPLLSWAIDAEPSPGHDLPARPLPDHRRAYLNYEGPISGNRGTVRRVASGTCRIVASEPGRVAIMFDRDEAIIQRSFGDSVELRGGAASAGGAWTARFESVEAPGRDGG